MVSNLWKFCIDVFIIQYYLVDSEAYLFFFGGGEGGGEGGVDKTKLIFHLCLFDVK